jgi:hypothetical protein
METGVYVFGYTRPVGSCGAVAGSVSMDVFVAQQGCATNTSMDTLPANQSWQPSCSHGTYQRATNTSMDTLPANRSWQPSCSHGTYQRATNTSMDTLPANRSWQPSCSHGTYQHEAIRSRSRQLPMMGTWLPETCWTTSTREIKDTKVTSSWFFLSTKKILLLFS